jgi:hypothetical protein
MFVFDFYGVVKLELLIACFADLHDISKEQLKDIVDITTENIPTIGYYEYILFNKGDFKTRFSFLPPFDHKPNLSYLTRLYTLGWDLSQKLGIDIVVSPTDDIKDPYQWFLIKDGIFYLADELFEPDSEDENEDYGQIMDYTTLVPAFDKLPNDVQEYILANSNII